MTTPQQSIRAAGNDTLASARQAASDLRDDAVEGAKDIAGTAASHAGELQAQARDWVRRNMNMARDAAASLRAEAVAVNDRTQRYVRDEPVKSVLIAAAAGAAVAGLLMLLRQSGRRDRL